MDDRKCGAAVLAIGTGLPKYSAAQEDIGEWMAASLADRPAHARMIRSLCAYSGIQTRHSCIPDYFLPPLESRFAPGVPAERSPSTAERMALYEQEAVPLGAAAAQDAMEVFAAKAGAAMATVVQKVSHLVVVSCTGFFAPGVDFVMAQALGLSPHVERTLIGFMGCSAMFNGLRTAAQIVHSNPDALVLVVSIELCSLHSQPNPGRDLLIGASLFADGASACVVGRSDRLDGDYFLIDDFYTSMKPETEGEMAWQIGNYGFTLRLSPRVPEHLAEIVPDIVATIFAQERPGFWAIHPGGRAIIDRLAEILELDESDVAASRSVLRRVGNVSSATILYVLAELQRTLPEEARHAVDMDYVTAAGDQSHHSMARNGRLGLDTRYRTSGVAMAFGPGLVVEMAKLTYVPPRAVGLLPEEASLALACDTFEKEPL